MKSTLCLLKKNLVYIYFLFRQYFSKLILLLEDDNLYESDSSGYSVILYFEFYYEENQFKGKVYCFIVMNNNKF